MLNLYIEKLMPIVKKMCSESKTGGHDIDHFLRTMKNALFLQSIEGGDYIIIGIASFLHDIHRLMQSEKKRIYKTKRIIKMCFEYY